MNQKQSRRTFLRTASVAVLTGVAAPTLISRTALADGNTPGANERIGVAGIGVGRRGSEIFGSAAKNPKTQAICVADVWLPRAESVAKNNGCDAAYQDYRRVLERKDVDAITTATPEHCRGLICINACLAGKHVYGEKPITLTINEGKLMEKAARRNNVVFQTGSQQRSMKENHLACEFIRNGELGEIKEVIAANYESPWLCNLPEQPIPEGLDWETWCGPTPVVPYNIDLFTPRAKPGWLSFRPYSGGEMTNWGAHGVDQIQWALGADNSGPVALAPMPSGNGAVAAKYADGTEVHFDLEYGKAPMGGAIFRCEEGNLEINRNNLKSNPQSLIADAPEPDPPEGPTWIARPHIENFFDCMVTRERPHADVEIGHRSVSVCHLVNITRILNRPLQWDPEKETFIGDDEANSYVDRPRRKGYELPEV